MVNIDCFKSHIDEVWIWKHCFLWRQLIEQILMNRDKNYCARGFFFSFSFFWPGVILLFLKFDAWNYLECEPCRFGRIHHSFQSGSSTRISSCSLSSVKQFMGFTWTAIYFIWTTHAYKSYHSVCAASYTPKLTTCFIRVLEDWATVNWLSSAYLDVSLMVAVTFKSFSC